jgi:hypothetical protein
VTQTRTIAIGGGDVVADIAAARMLDPRSIALYVSLVRNKRRSRCE